MRHGKQTCEGWDWRHEQYCLSEAHWHIKIFLDNGARRTWDVYLCTQCHAFAELELAHKSIPRKTTQSVEGWEASGRHTYATRRYQRLFAHECKIEQLPLFQAA